MDYDIIIKNGLVVDGSGSAPYQQDIGVKGERIKHVKHLENAKASVLLDAAGLIVCPGFVDIHSHADEYLLIDNRAESAINQGITSICCGNCGISPFPSNELNKNLINEFQYRRIPSSTLREHFESIERIGTSVNVSTLVGHGALRSYVMAYEKRLPSRHELEQMKALLLEAMNDGAVGMSTGLEYPPGYYSDTEELIELCRVVNRSGGIYTTHTRCGRLNYIDAVEEAIRTAEQSDNTPLQISHIESHYPHWGMTETVLDRVDRAKDEGLDVFFDIPPYVFGESELSTIIPKDYHEGGIEGLIARLTNSSSREEIRKRLGNMRANEAEIVTMAMAVSGLWDRILIQKCSSLKEYSGLSIEEISKIERKDPFEVVFDLLIREGRGVVIIYRGHNEEDMQRILKHESGIIETDEWIYSPHGELGKLAPHPRAYGTFPMIFRKYVRGETRPDFKEEQGKSILTIEAAVHKMTNLPAQRLRLKDRGTIRQGMFADIVVFDGNSICDRATYKNPHLFPVGIKYVMVNGTLTIENGKHTGALAGKVLRRAS